MTFNLFWKQSEEEKLQKWLTGGDWDHPSKQCLDIPFVLLQQSLLLAVCPAAQRKIPFTLAGVSGGGIKTGITAIPSDNINSWALLFHKQ